MFLSINTRGNEKLVEDTNCYIYLCKSIIENKKFKTTKKYLYRFKWSDLSSLIRIRGIYNQTKQMLLSEITDLEEVESLMLDLKEKINKLQEDLFKYSKIWENLFNREKEALKEFPLNDDFLNDSLLNDKQNNKKITDGDTMNNYLNNTKLKNNPTFNIKQFNNNNIRVYQSNIGDVISLSTLSRSLSIQRPTLYTIINKNKLSLSDNLIKIKINHSYQICLTKDGIINVLNNINHYKLTEKKIDNIEKFKQWLVPVTNDLKGSEPSITQENTAISELIHTDDIKNDCCNHQNLDLKVDDIDKVFDDIENDLMGIFKRLKNATTSLKEDRDNEKQRNSVLEDINNKYRMKTLNLQDRINKLKYC